MVAHIRPKSACATMPDARAVVMSSSARVAPLLLDT
jgi:hypothetical protein